jgi:hypothetical protein
MAKMMWKPSDIAICERAARRSVMAGFMVDPAAEPRHGLVNAGGAG